MNEALGAICDVMKRMYGRDITLYDEVFLVKSIDRRLEETGIKTVAAYVETLSGNNGEAEALYRSLNITYSEFFRNALTFSLLEQIVLPSLVEAKKRAGRGEIRIWSSACAAGQEAYSIAILLDELRAAWGDAVAFRIFATDISESELTTAREGVYDFAAVHNVSLKHIRDCFTQRGEHFMILPRLKELVQFSTYDLLDERSVCPPASIYGDFDLVFCGNLLLYYRSDVRRLILDKLWRALSPEGYFVVGEAEREIVANNQGFRAIAPPAAIFQSLRVDSPQLAIPSRSPSFPHALSGVSVQRSAISRQPRNGRPTGFVPRPVGAYPVGLRPLSHGVKPISHGASAPVCHLKLNADC